MDTATEVIVKENNEVVDSIKHPLEHPWDMWLCKNLQIKNWEQNLVKFATFDTVEDYWCLYHNLKLPSELPFGQDYYVIKDAIRPVWEDPANKSGGRWIIVCDKRQNVDLDACWLDVVLLMIGENFVNNDQVRGAVVNMRQGGKSKICVWMADSSNEKANCEVGRKIKSQLGIRNRFHFYAHNSTTCLYSV